MYHLGGKNIEVWMLSEIARVMKCVPAHLVAEQLHVPQSVLSNILGVYALTGCNIMLSLYDKDITHAGKCSFRIMKLLGQCKGSTS